MKHEKDLTVEPGTYLSLNADETFQFGRSIGERLTGGEVFLLSGTLGAGKTIFVKGVAAGLGIDSDDVTSPSFTLVNRHDGRLRLYHLDLYRITEGPSAAYAVGLDELLDEHDAVILIEWGERLGGYSLRATVYKVTIEGDGEAPRKITVSAF